MSSDGIKVGDYVTVVEGKSFNGGRDGSYSGSLLEVLAISEPFALLREHVSKHGCKSESHPVLNMTEWKLGHLEREFIDAMFEVVKR